MPGERFFDTNNLICAFASNDPRSARAEALIAEGGAIGVQVLNEFTNVTRRKLDWDWPQVEAALAVIKDLLGPVRPLTLDIHEQAIVLARVHSLSFYDAAPSRSRIRSANSAGRLINMPRASDHRMCSSLIGQNPSFLATVRVLNHFGWDCSMLETLYQTILHDPLL